MAAAADDSLVLGLRALATLACRGPLDTAALERRHGGGVSAVAAVIGVLEDAGLVHRPNGQGLIAVTDRGAALTGRPRQPAQ